MNFKIINLVMPSISRPYLTSPVTDDKLLLHNAYRKLQQNRIESVFKELFTLKLNNNVSSCAKTLTYLKLKFKKKISRLVQKYHPAPGKRRTAKLKSCNP